MGQINFGGVVEEVGTRDEFSLEKARKVLGNEVVAILDMVCRGRRKP